MSWISKVKWVGNIYFVCVNFKVDVVLIFRCDKVFIFINGNGIISLFDVMNIGVVVIWNKSCVFICCICCW